MASQSCLPENLSRSVDPVCTPACSALLDRSGCNIALKGKVGHIMQIRMKEGCTDVDNEECYESAWVSINDALSGKTVNTLTVPTLTSTTVNATTVNSTHMNTDNVTVSTIYSKLPANNGQKNRIVMSDGFASDPKLVIVTHRLSGQEVAYF